MEGCQHSFHGLEKNIILTTITVHKTGLNVDEDHEDSAMTESLFFFMKTVMVMMGIQRSH